ncbi:MAG: hypothetical protein LBF91_03715, partial [Azoarcus sp.]|nr:hypothetical protein [Azoarcus sp.]
MNTRSSPEACGRAERIQRPFNVVWIDAEHDSRPDPVECFPHPAATPKGIRMERFFNTAGPIIPEDHYHIDMLSRVDWP